MEKTIIIGSKEVKFKATASTTRKYRAKFHRDMLLDMKSLLDAMQRGDDLTSVSLESFENIAYIMAKQADETVPDDPDEWLDEFEVMNIYSVLPDLISLWGISAQPTIEAKKK